MTNQIETTTTPSLFFTAISKITEKVLPIRIRYFLKNCDILSDCQFGFQEKRNMTSAIFRLMEQLYQSFNDSKITQGIFLTSARHLIPFDHSYLIISNISDRKQFVKLNDFKSS